MTKKIVENLKKWYNFFGEDMKKNIAFILSIVVVLIAFIVVYFKFNVYEVTFVVDNEIYETVEVRKNTTLESVPTPTKEGYAFIGWYEDNDTVYESNTRIKKDTVYYARWATIITSEEDDKTLQIFVVFYYL